MKARGADPMKGMESLEVTSNTAIFRMKIEAVIAQGEHLEIRGSGGRFSTIE